MADCIKSRFRHRNVISGPTINRARAVWVIDARQLITCQWTATQRVVLVDATTRTESECYDAVIRRYTGDQVTPGE